VLEDAPAKRTDFRCHNTDLIAVDYVYKLEDGFSYETRDTLEDATVTWRQVLFSEEQHAYLNQGDH